MQKNEPSFQRRPHRKLEELNLIDNFLFHEMLSNEETGEEFARILLETILGRNIRKVRIVPQKVISGRDTDNHGIRLDAYIEEVLDEELMPGQDMIDAQVTSDIYDIEPNNTYEKQSLPKRMRYYQGLIDTQVLSSGVNYKKLRNVFIIMILPYDPFGRKRMVYTVRSQCVEDTSIRYDDGATKIFLYTKGTEGNPSQGLKDMLRYIEKTTTENVTNQSIETINNLVKKVKQSKEVGINQMKSWEIEEMIADEARQEGLAEGLRKGIVAYIKICKETSFSREETVLKTATEFPITKEEAEDYVNDIW